MQQNATQHYKEQIINTGNNMEESQNSMSSEKIQTQQSTYYMIYFIQSFKERQN